MSVPLHIIPKEEQHPHARLRAHHENGVSTLCMPNGSLLSVSHHPDLFELQASMTITVSREWEAHDLRTWHGRPHEGNYYCPRCHCRKAGDGGPNAYDEPCDDRGCLCHEGIDEL